MEIKPGYKITGAGIIPDEWEAKSLADIGTIRTGPFGTLLKAHEYYASEGVPLVSVRDIGEGELIFDEQTPLVPPVVVRRLPQYVLKAGDIVCGRKGGVERSALVRARQAGCFLGSDGIRIRPSKRCHAPFVIHQLQREEVRDWLRQNAIGTTMASMNQEILRRVSVPYPDETEQRAIAEALSDVDELIRALEALIAKKRAIKQAVMQQLLTGNTRLPGFGGEWKSRRIGDLARIQRGASPRPIDNPIWFDENSSIGWVRISDVTSSSTYLRSTTQKLSQLGVRHSRPVATGSLLMSICATVGRPVITALDLCIHDGFVVFEKLDIDQLFLYHVLTSIEEDWSKSGQTGSQMNLNTGLINRTEIRVPPRDEQAAIATVLSDMDAEIAALEARCDKTRAIKQGMMQQLLTGRIRLVKPQPAEADA